MTPLFMSNLPHRCIIAPSNFCSTRNFYTIPVMPRFKVICWRKYFCFNVLVFSQAIIKQKNKTILIKTKQKPKQIKIILVYLICYRFATENGKQSQMYANFGPEWITTSCVFKIYPVIPLMTFDAIKLSSWKVSP